VTLLSIAPVELLKFELTLKNKGLGNFVNCPWHYDHHKKIINEGWEIVGYIHSKEFALCDHVIVVFESPQGAFWWYRIYAPPSLSLSEFMECVRFYKLVP